MNTKFKNLLKNISYTFTSNIVSLGISVVLTLFVPKLLGVKEYAYWQLYVFYSTYVGFFHLGWIDGIYLKIGGMDYHDLDKDNLKNQFWLLNIFEFFIAIAIAVFAMVFVKDQPKALILVYTAICGVITIARTFLLFILQSTNRIKEYASYTRNDRFIYFILVVAYLLLGGRSVTALIFADIISRLVILIVMCLKSCRDIVFPPKTKLLTVRHDIVDNIKIGSNLMFANVASLLIVGIIRMGIESQWNVEVFGKVSLTLSVSNLLLTFITAIGVVIFPLLRKMDQTRLAEFYSVLREPLMFFLYSCLLFYYPMKTLLSLWLPQYADALIYMAILFPMFIYESKMSLVVNTYLKTLRMEKTILIVNIISVCVSMLLTLIFAVFLNNLFLTILSIVVVIAIRCNLAELFLTKKLNLSFLSEMWLETAMTIIFIGVSYLLPPLIAAPIYLVVLGIYFLLKRTKIVTAVRDIKNLIQQ